MQQPEPVGLLIADISGYTRYLAGVEQLDAESAARSAEQAEESALPVPAADGILKGL